MDELREEQAPPLQFVSSASRFDVISTDVSGCHKRHPLQSASSAPRYAILIGKASASMLYPFKVIPNKNIFAKRLDKWIFLR